MVYITSKADETLSGYCLCGGKLLNVKIESSAVTQIPKVKDYFSKLTKLYEIILHEDQAIPAFVL